VTPATASEFLATVWQTAVSSPAERLAFARCHVEIEIIDETRRMLVVDPVTRIWFSREILPLVDFSRVDVYPERLVRVRSPDRTTAYLFGLISEDGKSSIRSHVDDPASVAITIASTTPDVSKFLPESPLRLKPGHFYRARDGAIWCCYGVNPREPVHARARCVLVASHRLEYFYEDGRYDREGKREHTLVEEVAAP
jgi:hypothetical protein